MPTGPNGACERFHSFGRVEVASRALGLRSAIGGGCRVVPEAERGFPARAVVDGANDQADDDHDGAVCERDGLVERRPDPDDGRAGRVHLTAEARSFQPAGERVLARRERESMGTLGERRLAELRKSLEQLS